MQEANSHLKGVLLRGSSLYEEKAMKILAEYDYDYDMAKFSVLYPTVMIMPHRKKKFLDAIKEDPGLLKRVV